MAKAPEPKTVAVKAPTTDAPTLAEIRRQAAMAAYAKVRMPEQPPAFADAGDAVQSLILGLVDAVLGVLAEMNIVLETTESEASDRRLERLSKKVEKIVQGISVVPVDGETPEDKLVRQLDVMAGLFSRRRDRPQ